MTWKSGFIPYGRQTIDEEDVAAVAAALRSDYLTTGPSVAEFEDAFAAFVGAGEAAAVSSGTAALHSAMFAIGVGSGDEVIVPAMTFAASANCVVYQGATPVFADVNADTLLVDPEDVERKITPRTKGIIGVDYAGQPCDWDALRTIAGRHGLVLIDDACHAVGAEYKGRRLGTQAHITCFSFHPVKHITTGEGGMVVTNDPEQAKKIRCFRNHGISTDHHQRELQGTWYYEMTDLGYNYRITDFQCVLGLSQLKKLPNFLMHRRRLATRYPALLANIPEVEPLAILPDRASAWHLYVVRLAREFAGNGRSRIFAALRAAEVGANVHYLPVYLHPFYRRRFGGHEGLCPMAEEAYKRIISLPIFPGLSDAAQEKVVEVLAESLHRMTE